jgi:hypothetical protein
VNLSLKTTTHTRNMVFQPSMFYPEKKIVSQGPARVHPLARHAASLDESSCSTAPHANTDRVEHTKHRPQFRIIMNTSRIQIIPDGALKQSRILRYDS